MSNEKYTIDDVNKYPNEVMTAVTNMMIANELNRLNESISNFLKDQT